MSLSTLIQKLAPEQEDFLPYKKNGCVPKPKPIFKEFGLSDKQIRKLICLSVDKTYSLYASFMTLTVPSYTYEDQQEAIDQFIRDIIAKMTKDTSIQRHLKQVKISRDQLSAQIKNKDEQSDKVVYYLSLVFDLNILIIGNKVCLFFSDKEYDPRKPHILLHRNDNNVFCPIIYQDIAEDQRLGPNNEIVKQLMKSPFSTFCQQDLLPKKSLDKLKATELRALAEQKGIDIKKISSISGNRIYKKKEELIADISTASKI